MSGYSESVGGSLKRLQRSRVNRVIAGVCGGIGEFLNIDPTLVRLAFIILAFANGLGVILYIIAIFIVPLNPSTTAVQAPPFDIGISGKLTGNLIILAVGAIILLIGLFMLFMFSVGWNPFEIFAFIGKIVLPLSLIILGLAVLIIGLNSRSKTEPSSK